MHSSSRPDAMHRPKTNLFASMGCTCTSFLNSLLLMCCTGLLFMLVMKSGRMPTSLSSIAPASSLIAGNAVQQANSIQTTATSTSQPPPPPAVAAPRLTFNSLDIILGPSMERVDAMHWVNEAVKELDKRNIKVEGECDARFGIKFLREWRANTQPLCKSSPAAAAGNPLLAESQIRSWTTSHNGKMWMVADASNVVLDSRLYSSKVDGDGNPKPQSGGLKAACALDTSAGSLFAYPVAQEIRDALAGEQGDAVLQACGSNSATAAGGTQQQLRHVIEHPVLLLHRYDTTNAYHNLEDVMTVFLAMALLDSPAVKAKGLEIVIADGKSLGFYPEFWQRISHPHKVRILRNDPFPAGTCFRHLLRTPYAIASLLSYTGVGAVSQCNSPIIVGFSHWLRSSLFPEITSVRRAFDVALQTQRGDKRIVTRTVIWVTRRNYEGLSSRSWNGWQTGRMFANEHDLLISLHKAILEWNDQACFRSDRLPMRLRGLSSAEQHTLRSSVLQSRRLQGNCRDKHTVFELQVMELSDVAFYPDQLDKLTRMSILVAAHGAGLANEIWMKPGAGAVIELGHNSGGNFHYENMAHWLGHKYKMVRSSGRDVDTQQTANTLKEMMDELA